MPRPPHLGLHERLQWAGAAVRQGQLFAGRLLVWVRGGAGIIGCPSPDLLQLCGHTSTQQHVVAGKRLPRQLVLLEVLLEAGAVPGAILCSRTNTPQLLSSTMFSIASLQGPDACGDWYRHFSGKVVMHEVFNMLD